MPEVWKEKASLEFYIEQDIVQIWKRDKEFFQKKTSF